MKEGETPILYINRHLIHEVTSPQAFDGLRVANRQVRQVNKTFGTMIIAFQLKFVMLTNYKDKPKFKSKS